MPAVTASAEHRERVVVAVCTQAECVLVEGQRVVKATVLQVDVEDPEALAAPGWSWPDSSSYAYVRVSSVIPILGGSQFLRLGGAAKGSASRGRGTRPSDPRVV